VLIASDAGEAFKHLASAQDVALVILDLMLPGMNGLEILSVLRADDHWRKVPCLILTAAGHDGQFRQAEALGVSGVLTKPFSPRRLYERVVTLTHRPPSSARMPASDADSSFPS
jgi:DNA-binding response OmpR family regulator